MIFCMNHLIYNYNSEVSIIWLVSKSDGNVKEQCKSRSTCDICLRTCKGKLACKLGLVF